jgi:hypothetical protein
MLLYHVILIPIFYIIKINFAFHNIQKCFTTFMYQYQKKKIEENIF